MVARFLNLSMILPQTQNRWNPPIRFSTLVLIVGLLPSGIGHAAEPAGSETPGGPAPVTFRKVRLTDEFWAEGVAVADVNRDGHKDVISGPYWYEGPTFEHRHAFREAFASFARTKPDGTTERVAGYDGASGWSDDFLTYAADINGDGWPDVLVVGFPGKEAAWYENPGAAGLAQGTPWKRHLAFDSVGNESPAWVDLFQDGHPVLLFMQGDVLGYGTPDPAAPDGKWVFHPLTTPLPIVQDMRARYEQENGGKPFPYFPYCHGLGCGDVNGDGRLDLLEMEGWWEQPPGGRQGGLWRLHPWTFLKQRPPASRVAAGNRHPDYYNWPYALRASQMYVYDVNGDGRPDLISSLDAHGYGVGWFEQLANPSGDGEARFEPHFMVEPSGSPNRRGVSFTEPHALNVADLDGDGLVDVVTGKRKWAETAKGPDPETDGASVLYWFKLVRQADHTARFVPFLIDHDSGVGEQVWIGDLNGDGRPDLAVSNKNGTFVFLQETPAPLADLIQDP